MSQRYTEDYPPRSRSARGYHSHRSRSRSRRTLSRSRSARSRPSKHRRSKRRRSRPRNSPYHRKNSRDRSRGRDRDRDRRYRDSDRGRYHHRDADRDHAYYHNRRTGNRHNRRSGSYHSSDGKGRRRRRRHNGKRKKKYYDRDDSRRRRRDSYSKRTPSRTPSSEKDDSVGAYKGRPGDVIGDYRSIRTLGEGTFGLVVECIRTNLTGAATPVAVKVVRAVPRYTEEAQVEASIIMNIQKEGRKVGDMASLSRIVHLHEHFAWRDHYCLVFESLGASLYDYQRKCRSTTMELRHIKVIAGDIFQALAFLHNQCHLVHTDLKLENVLFEANAEQVFPRSYRVKLIDFGGATYISTDKIETALINTRQYRSPEVTIGIGWSYPSDIWSAGCLLMELLCGRLLFQTHDELEHLALIQRIIGPFPKTMRSARAFFNSDGELRWPPSRRSREYSSERVDFVSRSEKLKELTSKHCMLQLPTQVTNIEEVTWFCELISRCLCIDPNERITAREAYSTIFPTVAKSENSRSNSLGK